jgi:hypothetical protein
MSLDYMGSYETPGAEGRIARAEKLNALIPAGSGYEVRTALNNSRLELWAGDGGYCVGTIPDNVEDWASLMALS